MFSEQTLIIINVACIAFLAMMLIVLAAATKMKGGAGWAALIMVATTVPAYFTNMIAVSLTPVPFLCCVYITVTLNVMCMPALWFFMRSQLDKAWRFSRRERWHLVPAAVSLAVNVVFYSVISSEQVAENMKLIQSGNNNLPTSINSMIVFVQFFAYFAAMFFYIRKKKKFLQDNYADSDYVKIHWIPNFLLVFFVLFSAVFIGYAIDTAVTSWLVNPVLNTIGTAYLIYIAIRHSTFAYINRLPDVPDEVPQIAEIAAEPPETVAEPQAEPQPHEKTAAAPAMSSQQMKEICDTVTQYLKTSEAYKNCDLALATVAHETGINHRNISDAINGYLHHNFL
jgi:hypothetical protein